MAGIGTRAEVGARAGADARAQVLSGQRQGQGRFFYKIRKMKPKLDYSIIKTLLTGTLGKMLLLNLDANYNGNCIFGPQKTCH